MRVQGVVILLAAFGAAQAQAASIATPSIIMLGDENAVDPSIVAAVSGTEPTPSIVTVPDTTTTPSIIALGEPADGDAEVAERSTTPMVIRGGEVGSASARPSPTPAKAAAEPLLDPNDRGTPAKRKALKRQEERLAREAAAAGAQTPQSDPSTEPAPLGR